MYAVGDSPPQPPKKLEMSALVGIAHAISDRGRWLAVDVTPHRGLLRSARWSVNFTSFDKLCSGTSEAASSSPSAQAATLEAPVPRSCAAHLVIT